LSKFAISEVCIKLVSLFLISSPEVALGLKKVDDPWLKK